MTATIHTIRHHRHPYHRNRLMHIPDGQSLSQQSRPVSHFGDNSVLPPQDAAFPNEFSCQNRNMNAQQQSHCQHRQRPYHQRNLPRSCRKTTNAKNPDVSVRNHPEARTWIPTSSETFFPPAADELSSFSSNQNSLEASLHASQQSQRQLPQGENGRNYGKDLLHSFVLTPPSPSRHHVPKRPRFEGMNVVETLIQNLFSCGCVHGIASNIQPESGFASRPFTPHNKKKQETCPNNGGSAFAPPPQSVHQENMQMSRRALLSPPPKVRRMTLEEAANELDVTFMM